MFCYKINFKKLFEFFGKFWNFSETIMVIQASGKEYHSVEIQLGTVLIPKEKLELTPSMEEGLKPETETELRNMGGELIQKAGIYLKLPQVAIASAQVLFQRFFYAKVSSRTFLKFFDFWNFLEFSGNLELFEFFRISRNYFEVYFCLEFRLMRHASRRQGRHLAGVKNRRKRAPRPRRY